MDKTLSDGGTATDGIQILISYALWVRGVRSLSGGKVPPGRPALSWSHSICMARRLHWGC
jgi:hypothetical protein